MTILPLYTYFAYNEKVKIRRLNQTLWQYGCYGLAVLSITPIYAIYTIYTINARYF